MVKGDGRNQSLPRSRSRNGNSSNCRKHPSETWRTVHIPSSRLMLSDCQTDIRIGTRIDKQINQGGNAGKVSRVEDILAKDTK